VGGGKSKGERKVGNASRDIQVIARFEIRQVFVQLDGTAGREGQSDRGVQVGLNLSGVPARRPCGQVELDLLKGAQFRGHQVLTYEAVWPLKAGTGIGVDQVEQLLC